jgi:hypothetical protein
MVERLAPNGGAKLRSQGRENAPVPGFKMAVVGFGSVKPELGAGCGGQTRRLRSSHGGHYASGLQLPRQMLGSTDAALELTSLPAAPSLTPSTEGIMHRVSRPDPWLDRLNYDRDHLAIQISLLADAETKDPARLAVLRIRLDSLERRISEHRLAGG